MNNITTMEDKANTEFSATTTSPPEHLCYVRCNFCKTVLAVVIPCKRLLETVTVKCGHCGNVSFLTTRPPLQGQCLDHHQIALQGYNFMDKPSTGGSSCGITNNTNNTTNTSNTSDVFKREQPSSSSSSSASIDPIFPRPYVVKPPEKKHRLPSAYNRFMKEEIQRIKAANPEIPHREAFSTAAKNWARFLPHNSAGSIAETCNRL